MTWQGVTLLMLVPLLAGCMSGHQSASHDDTSPPGETPGTGDGGDPPDPTRPSAPGFDVNVWRPCEHPWPCGDGSEWPRDLDGPFAWMDTDPDVVEVPSADGTLLRGWIVRPVVPDGVRVPIVLEIGIYETNFIAAPNYWQYQGQTDQGPLMSETLVAQGYAYAMFNVRGAGLSDGCFDFWAPEHREDALAVLEYLADQSWSNGRIGMIGESYDSFVGLLAGTHAPPMLKTVTAVAFGPLSVNEGFHTPQGVKHRLVVPVWASDNPTPVVWPDALAGHIARQATRACPETLGWRTAGSHSWVSDDRDPGYWSPRDFTNDWKNITAALLLPHGVYDRGPTLGDWGIGMAQDIAWQEATSAPKRMIHGPWGHTNPAHQAPNAWFRPDGWEHLDAWQATVVEWYDFWLKGVGAPPAVGIVEYSPDRVDVRTSTAWPPGEARTEVLYLSGGGLAPEANDFAASYEAVPVFGKTAYGFVFDGDTDLGYPDDLRGPGVIACTPIDPRGLVFRSAPLQADALLAGNPWAYLDLESSTAGGIVTVYLFDMDPDGTCNLRFLTAGAANLRLHNSGYKTHDFPVGQAEHVRIDLDGALFKIAKDHQFVVVISAGDPQDFVTRDGGTITVRGDGSHQSSHIVLPFVEGTLHGENTSLDYPPRPFTAAWHAG